MRASRLSHQNIGRGLAARSRFDAQGIVRSGRHNVVQIGVENQLLLAAVAFDGQPHCKKGDVLDLDAAALDRCDQAIAAIRLAAQNGSKEFDERRPADRRPAIKPCTITGDAHVEIAAIERRPIAAGIGTDR